MPCATNNARADKSRVTTVIAAHNRVAPPPVNRRSCDFVRRAIPMWCLTTSVRGRVAVDNDQLDDLIIAQRRRLADL